MKQIVINSLIIIIGLIGFSVDYVIYQSNTDSKSVIKPVASVQPVIVAKPVAPSLQQDPQIVKLMQELGLDYSQLNLIHAANPRLPDAPASYTQPNIIYVTDKLSYSVINVAVSHEYIHYIQFTHNAEASSYYPEATALTVNNSWFHNRTVRYRNGELCQTNCLPLGAEFEALACTEMSDRYLSPDFAAFCNKYLKNRYMLFL